MATPTSSSNRSKRKSTKPVTADKGRTNRARVSTAKTTSSETRSSNSGARVTNASQRTSTGSARVTGTSRQALPAKSSASDLQRLQTASKTKPTRPAPKPQPRPIPATGTSGKPVQMGSNNWPKGTESWADKSSSGQRGGALVTQGTRRSRAEAKARTAAQGSTGPNRVGRSDARPALPPGKPGGAMTRASAGGALARTARGAANVAKGGRGAGRLLGPVGTALAAAETARNVFNPKDNIITRGAALGRSIERVVGSGGGSNLTPGQRNAQLAAKRGQRQGPQQTSEMVADYKVKRDARHQSLRDKMPPAKPRVSTPSGGGNSSPSRSGGGGNNTASRTSAPRSQTPPKPRFTGTVDEGRKMWAEKYSSSKYEGQAIQKEAKKLLDEMKKRKEDKSNATKAGWDGNKNY